MTAVYHIPVLLEESVSALAVRPDGVYVDVTYGGGGHSAQILDCLGVSGKLLAFDRDGDAEANVSNDERLIFIRNNFRFLANLLRYNGVEQIDGLLADLGISSHHIDDPERGFSFRFDGELDMRMNKDASFSAKELVATYSVQDLQRVLSLYGELDNAGRVASRIEAARQQSAIVTVQDLVAVLTPFAPKHAEHKFFAKVFQALRIEVNKEMDALQQMLVQALKVLKPGGRLVVITYHSLEDRLVKNFMRSGNFQGVVEKDFYGREHVPFTVITRKAIMPSDEEVKENNRARSAKLRVAEKK